MGIVRDIELSPDVLKSFPAARKEKPRMTRPRMTWAAVLNEPAPLAHPLEAITSPSLIKGKVHWWVGADEEPDAILEDLRAWARGRR